jgi:DNA-binding response OmpR family regulator
MPPRPSALIVGFPPEVAEALAVALRRGGFSPRVLGGEEAVWAARTQSPDAVIFDLGCPEAEGWELAGRLRAARPRLVLLALGRRGWTGGRRRVGRVWVDLQLRRTTDPGEVVVRLGELLRAPERGAAARGPRFRYRHQVTLAAPSEQVARVLAAQLLPPDGWARVEVGEFSLLGRKGGRFTLSVPFTVRADDEGAARRLLERLLGVRDGFALEALEG